MVQLKQDEHVIGQPADEESSHECSHDFEWFGGFSHPAGSKSEDDDRVADDDDGERDNKPCKEAAPCHNLVTVLVWRIIVQANGPTQVSANIPKDHRGKAQCDCEKPGHKNNNGCLFDSATVLGPNRKHHWHAAVNADDNQEEDAAEHVEEHNEGDKFAHEVAKDPLLHHHVGDVEWEEGAEDKVGDRKAQVPGCVDRLLHLEARNPDDQSISKEAQQKNDHADQEQRHTWPFF